MLSVSEDCCQFWKIDRLRKHSTLNKSPLNTQVVTTEKVNKICIQSGLNGTLALQGTINTTMGWFLNGPAFYALFILQHRCRIEGGCAKCQVTDAHKGQYKLNQTGDDKNKRIDLDTIRKRIQPLLHE